jgi:hypothetical protein
MTFASAVKGSTVTDLTWPSFASLIACSIAASSSEVKAFL